MGKSLFDVLINRYGMVADIDKSPSEVKWSMTESQFLRQVDKVVARRDMIGMVVRNEVTDILNTRGGEAGRFKW